MKHTFEVPVRYEAEFYIWSRIGHCPITNRAGAYCDELVKTKLFVLGPCDAETVVRNLLATTPHASKGYFNIPAWPNQNTRSNWL